MKKLLMSAAIVAALGFSAYLGFRPEPTTPLSELQLANAEALSDDELPPIEIVCPYPSDLGGYCHKQKSDATEKDCGGLPLKPCEFNGVRTSICVYC